LDVTSCTGRIAFLGDVHLERGDLPRARVFLRALRSIYSQCSHIYILGDLFEFWCGPSHAYHADYRFALEQMDLILDGRTPVTVLHGNRDYFLADRFPVGKNVTVEWDPITLSLDDLTVYLCHGDALLSRDVGYLFVRRLFHNRLVTRLNQLLPADLAYYISHGYRSHSKRSVQRKIRSAEHILSITSEAVTPIFEKGADVIVCGHVHRQEVCGFVRADPNKPWRRVPPLDNADGSLYTLGDWRNAAPVLFCENRRFFFRDLSSPEGVAST